MSEASARMLAVAREEEAEILSALRSWDRERIAAAVEYARSTGAVGLDALPPDPGKWPSLTRGVVHAADSVRKRFPLAREASGPSRGTP